MRAPRALKTLVASLRDFGRDDGLAYGAGLAFYTALSLAPMVVVLLFVTSGLGTARTAFVDEVRGVVGPSGAEALDAVVAGASRELATKHGGWSLAIAILTSVVSATAVFGQLQRALNRVWNVKPVPGFRFGEWLRRRLLSFALLVTLGFLLLVSLGISTVLAMLFTEGALAWRIAELGISLAVFAGLFALIFKFLPDVRIAWREAWVGAVVTSVLFAAGKYAIGTYIGMSRIGQGYGAAGSLLALLVWVYWSSVIVLFGAEVTQTYVTGRRSVRARSDAVADEAAAPADEDTQGAPGGVSLERREGASRAPDAATPGRANARQRRRDAGSGSRRD